MEKTKGTDKNTRRDPEKMTKKKEIVRKGYDNIAEEYQANRHIFESTQELEEFSSYLPKGGKILDVGCGAGVPVTKFLVQHGYEVTGIDFSEGMLELARRNVPRAKFIQKDMTEMNFKDNSFDGLVAFYSIIHVPREEHFSLFQSFHRILRLGGVMLLCLGPDDWEATAEYYGTNMFWSHYNPEESQQLVQDAGFQIIFGKHLVKGEERHYWVLARSMKARAPRPFVSVRV